MLRTHLLRRREIKGRKKGSYFTFEEERQDRGLVEKKEKRGHLLSTIRWRRKSGEKGSCPREEEERELNTNCRTGWEGRMGGTAASISMRKDGRGGY